MKAFTVYREHDESGVSGTGRVIDGALFHTGQVVICWRTDVKDSDNPHHHTINATHNHSSLGIYPTWEAFYTIHIASHPKNNTRIEWHVENNRIDLEGLMRNCESIPLKVFGNNYSGFVDQWDITSSGYSPIEVDLHLILGAE